MKKAQPSQPKQGTDGQIPVAEYIAGFEPHIQALIREMRKVARSIAPGAEEKAYRGWGMHVSTDRGSIGIAPFRDHVNVNVRAAGAELRHPEVKLQGTGKAYRHLKVTTMAEAGGDELRGLVRRELATGERRLVLGEGKGKRILAGVRKICLALPDVTERLSHGTPTFFARGKQFAQVWAGHHADHGLQLWCAAPSGAQRALVNAEPELYFVPPYVGHRGWLGVRLDADPGSRVLEPILQDAHAAVAAPRGRGARRA